MKLCKKALIAAAVTGVLPSENQAAVLDQNLVQNPSFEDVSGTSANIWGGNVSTYAYSQNYTLGSAPGGGLRYWNGGGADPLAFQLIDLAGNAALIDAGQINYNFRSFFSGYRTQTDYSTVRALFLDGTSAQVGSAAIGGAAFVAGLPLGANELYPDAKGWGQDALTGLLPVGTRTVRIEIDSEKEPGVGNVSDGYVDLVDFQITAVPEPGTLSLVALGLLGGWMYVRRRR
jgi:hypothetical protein